MLDLRKYHRAAWKQVEDFRKSFLFQLLLRNIRQGTREGLFRDDVNAEVLARLRLEEATMTLDPEIFPRQTFDRPVVSQVILDHFVAGISTDAGMQLYQQYKANLTKENSLNTIL